MSEIMPVINDTLITIATAILGLLGAVAVNAIQKLSVKIQMEAIKLANEDDRNLINNAIWRLHELATTTVTSIEQTTAAALREAIKQGTAEPGALKDLATEAYYTIMENLSPEYQDALSEVFGDLETYVTNIIEQKVWELKRATHTPMP